ncbi:hypothetical protein I118_1104 [Bifidobacterium longum D2957]|nr:hypothetical protein I118_1104 [Bifidobacterium longum D2957]
MVDGRPDPGSIPGSSTTRSISHELAGTDEPGTVRIAP